MAFPALIYVAYGQAQAHHALKVFIQVTKHHGTVGIEIRSLLNEGFLDLSVPGMPIIISSFEGFAPMLNRMCRSRFTFNLRFLAVMLTGCEAKRKRKCTRGGCDLRCQSLDLRAILP